MSCLWQVAAAFLCAFALSGQPAPALVPGPAPLVGPLCAQLQPEGDPALVLDGARATKWQARQGRARFDLPDGAWGVYLEWEETPDQWQLWADGRPVDTGGAPWLHCYLPLGLPARQVELAWQGPATLCDIYFLGCGVPPGWVQQWQPPCAQADFLLLPTHADDEHLWFGGVMPLYAGERGLAVQVAYMVNHNGEPYRLHEQLDGLWEVGVRHYPVIPGFADVYSPSLAHARTIYDQQEVIAYQTWLIRRFRPSVIVGHDIAGEYGHGAHQLNTDSLLQAVEQAARPEVQVPGALAPWDVPKVYLHLYPENALVMDWDVPLARFGGKTAFEMAQAGFARHRSQQAYFSVEQSGPYDCRKFGLYRSLVGPDSRPDMTDHLQLAPPQAGKEEGE